MLNMRLRKNKYYWNQVLRHANSKRKNYNYTSNTHRRPKGMQVEFGNDLALQMETGYGGIRIQIGIGNGIEA